MDQSIGECNACGDGGFGGRPKRLVGPDQRGFCYPSASKTEANSNELIEAVIAAFESKEGRSEILNALRKRLAGAEPADIVRHSLNDLRDVSAILEAKAPDDAAAFKALLIGISQQVAKAAMEHTFLGFGGVRVSEAEKATLDDIAKTLGTTA